MTIQTWLFQKLSTATQATALDLWIVAATVWGEARGESPEGRLAVACVIRNRQQFHSRWQEKTLTAICQAPYQFSCWLKTDPNAPKLLALTLHTPGFAGCLKTAVDALSGALSPVGQSTHYYATSMHAPPLWAVDRPAFIVIGRHRFFEGIS